MTKIVLVLPADPTASARVREALFSAGLGELIQMVEGRNVDPTAIVEAGRLATQMELLQRVTDLAHSAAASVVNIRVEMEKMKRTTGSVTSLRALQNHGDPRPPRMDGKRWR